MEAADLRFALDQGLSVAFDKIRIDHFIALRVIHEEIQKLESEQSEKQRREHQRGLKPLNARRPGRF